MQQFFIQDIKNAQLQADQLKQCQKVLRMKAGDQIRLVDFNRNGGIYQFEDDTLENLTLVETIEFKENPIKIRLIASLIRSERLEWMIQKACELGVDEIVLYSAQNGVVKDFGSRTERKLERLNTIALEACEQSYRSHPVKVSGVLNLKDLESIDSECKLYADVNVDPLPHIYKHLDGVSELSILIGPEGGYSEKERSVLQASGFKAVSLGQHVLRAETASMVACTLIHAYEVNQ